MNFIFFLAPGSWVLGFAKRPVQVVKTAWTRKHAVPVTWTRPTHREVEVQVGAHVRFVVPYPFGIGLFDDLDVSREREVSCSSYSQIRLTSTGQTICPFTRITPGWV